MFSLKNIFIALVVFGVSTLGLINLNGMVLDTGERQIQLNTELLYTITFCGVVLCGGLLAFNLFSFIVPLMGVGESSEFEPEPMTLEEMYVADKEDEQTHNKNWRDLAIIHNGVYEDYRGFLRDGETNSVICDNGTDQRRVIVKGGRIVLNPKSIRPEYRR